MHADCIIVGQGICGTLLSYELVKAGKTVMVIDESLPFTAGKVASGLMNPVTGMRVAKTWMADELLPAAMATYRQFEQEYNISIINAIPLLEFHPDALHRDTFNERITQYPEHLFHINDDSNWRPVFNYHYGISAIGTTSIIDMRLLQDKWRAELKKKASITEEKFDIASLTVTTGCATYKHITANRIVFCDGAAGMNNPYFSRLPFSLNKGEALIASIPGLSRDYVYKNNLKIAPWQNDRFWIGSSFEWTFDNVQPTAAFRGKAEALLRNWLKLPYTVHDHRASVRPATVDHKPFAGFHPLHPCVGILNGMGAKGCMQAPFFAKSLAANIVRGEPINKEANVARYTRVLGK